MECQQCTMPAMVAYENGSIALCIDCDSKFKHHLNIKHRQLLDQINYINAEIESIIRAPGSPRFKTLTADEINLQEIPWGTDVSLLGIIDSSIAIINDHGQNDIAKPLKQLTEAIFHHDEMSVKQKNEILEHLASVSVKIAHGEEKYHSNLFNGLASSLSATFNGFKNLFPQKTKSKP